MGKDVNLKRASIGQAIMQAALEFYLHRCRLHWVYNFITTLPHDCSLTRSIVLGSAVLTRKFNGLEKNAAVTQGTCIPNHTSAFVQYVADNVDHNLRTLDGNDTFHGMGLIATVYP